MLQWIRVLSLKLEQRESGATLRVIPYEVSRRDDIERTIALAAKAWRPDVLFTNQAISGPTTPIDE